MPESKYSRYVITELKTDSRDLLPKPPMDPDGLDAFMKSHTKLLSLDDVVLKGSFYVECVWICPGKDIYPETAEPNAHAHDYDEVITFFGTDYSNPKRFVRRNRNLDGGRKIHADEKQHDLRA